MGARIARVAHELKSPVSLISGSVETLGQFIDALMQYVPTLEQRGGRDHDTARVSTELGIPYVMENASSLINICTEGVQRLDYVVDQLRSYAHRGPAAEMKTVDLRTVLSEAIALARQGRQVAADVRMDVEDHLPIIARATVLSQVLTNVIGNAFDAVATTPEPRVVIASRVIPSGVEVGQELLEVRVGDNGPGVPSASRDLVFLAFFTTKSRGSGLGLGLAIAREIVESQGGSIELAEPESPGATFVIRLPVEIGGGEGSETKRRK